MKLDDPNKYTDPFMALDKVLKEKPDYIEFDEGDYYISNFDDAKKIMENRFDNYYDQSDFFNTTKGSFGNRKNQIDISKFGIILIKKYYENNKGLLKGEFRIKLRQEACWPNSSNDLMLLFFLPILIEPKTNTKLESLLFSVLENSVYAGKKLNGSKLKRFFLKKKMHRALINEFKNRKKLRRRECVDLIDVILLHTEYSVSERLLAEIFLSFYFAITSSLAFVLSWSLYYFVSEDCDSIKKEWIVKESLRLWPVAWNLFRNIKSEHELSGLSVKNYDNVTVCPYAIHRHSENWDDPNSFRPQRWENERIDSAFMAFGWGEHKCIAASFSINLVADLLSSIPESGLAVSSVSTRPLPEAAVAPPKFTVKYLNV